MVLMSRFYNLALEITSLSDIAVFLSTNFCRWLARPLDPGSNRSVHGAIVGPVSLKSIQLNHRRCVAYSCSLLNASDWFISHFDFLRI